MKQRDVQIVERLKEYGLAFFELVEVNVNATNKLVGNIFVVSGVLKIFRDDLKTTEIENHSEVK
jgi:hypothetical protein